jgi:hypothetical protein
MDPDSTKDDALIDEWLASAPADSGPSTFSATIRHPLGMSAIVLGLVICVAMVALRPTGASREDADEGLRTLGIPTAFISAKVAELQPQWGPVSRHGCEDGSRSNAAEMVTALLIAPPPEQATDHRHRKPTGLPIRG